MTTNDYAIPGMGDVKQLYTPSTTTTTTTATNAIQTKATNNMYTVDMEATTIKKNTITTKSTKHTGHDRTTSTTRTPPNYQL